MSEPIEILRGVAHPWYCDNFGHMNVRWYGHFFDDAAFHLWPLYWGSHQKMLKQFGVHTVTASATARFLKELVAGDLFLVDSLLTRIGHKSCSFTERMLHVDTREVHATYETTEVFFDPQTRRSIEIPAPIRQALEMHHLAPFPDRHEYHPASNQMPTLFIFSGLPGTGKTTLARRLAQHYAATHLRVDTIEQALRDLCLLDAAEEGYRLAYRIAADNLQLGLNVVADSCNPIDLTRREWERVATTNGAQWINIEVTCGDIAEHRQRIESRIADIDRLQLPTWQEVLDREYDDWSSARIIIETSKNSVEQCLANLTCDRQPPQFPPGPAGADWHSPGKP